MAGLFRIALVLPSLYAELESDHEWTPSGE